MLRLAQMYRRSSLGQQVAVFSFIIACGFWTTDILKAFTRPTTVKYVKPIYYHTWGDLEVLGNSYYGGSGESIANNLPMHEFLSNGLLEVNPELPHPICQLINFSERKWKAKLQRASKTLGEAVDEYERRYRRAPPRGFDKWRVFPLHFFSFKSKLCIGGNTLRRITFSFQTSTIRYTETSSLIGESTQSI